MRWPSQNHPATVFETRHGDSVRLSRALMAMFVLALWLPAATFVCAGASPHQTLASWYGEAHRGKVMANGRKFNPERLTAASWFYSLGTKVRVTSAARRSRSVIVTITDRGPAWELVHDGRGIDLSHAAFRRLADPDAGLVAVKIDVLR
ncbi:MAG TPA: septal ring lytic transglycosylase RlpA family protein [Verrucomicrobiae bacterium]|nr:septal ring lytic transglycosylase RlpA family protein [Verrucomicrobiae bacterium]